MKKRLTLDYVKDKMSKEGYTLLSDSYKNSHTKLCILCPKGHEYLARWDDFRSGYRCPHCSGNAKLTYEYVKEYIESFGYKLLSEDYKNITTKLKVMCDKGHTYDVKFDNFKNGKRCPYCSGNAKLTYEYVKEYIESFNYILFSKEYINSESKLLIQCPNGHKPYWVKFSNFKHGTRCKRCDVDSRRHTYEYVNEYIKRYNYNLLSKSYIDSRTPLAIECDKKHVYCATFNSFSSGHRCPYCNNSRGEAEIHNILCKYKVVNYKEYTIKNCELKGLLPFDFYLPKYNICIEYDGVQHYKPIDFANKGYEWALDDFVGRKIRDTVKNIFCKNNNIKLIRIPYWEFDNIEKILCKELNIKLRRKGNKQLK